LERGLVVCDRAVILNRGKIVYQAERSELDPAMFGELYRSIVERQA